MCTLASSSTKVKYELILDCGMLPTHRMKILSVSEQVDDQKEWRLPSLRNLSLANLVPISMHAARGPRNGFLNTNNHFFRIRVCNSSR